MGKNFAGIFSFFPDSSRIKYIDEWNFKGILIFSRGDKEECFERFDRGGNDRDEEFSRIFSGKDF